MREEKQEEKRKEEEPGEINRNRERTERKRREKPLSKQNLPTLSYQQAIPNPK